MVHDVYGAVIERTYRHWKDGAVGLANDEDENSRLQVQKKAWRTKCYCADVQRQRSAAFAVCFRSLGPRLAALAACRAAWRCVAGLTRAGAHVH